MAGNRLTVFDTTLRDGEQAPGYSMRIHGKVRLARLIAGVVQRDPSSRRPGR